MEPHVQVLGTPVVRTEDGRFEPQASKTSALLLYLACSEGWVSRDDLLYLLWPDSDERSGRNSLRQALHRLKDVAWANDVERERGRVRWNASTDLSSFRQARQTGNQGEAVRAYRGRLLEGFRLPDAPEFEAWLDLAREQLHDQWRESAWACAASLRQTGHAHEAASLLGAVVTADPLDESAVRGQMLALWEAGARTDALSVYEAFRQRLMADLGVEPEPRTRELAEDLRSGRDPTGVDGVSAESPQGGRFGAAAAPMGDPFGTPASLPRHATPFVGRRTELKAMRRSVLEHGARLLSVVGAGGMGKTRLALAFAHEMVHSFREGAAFASFAAIESPSQMPPVLADALGLSLAPIADPRDQLAGFLAPRHMLLVLDNLEQLKEDLSLIDVLLDRCPDVTIVSTTRERLGLGAETIFDLGGMEHAPPAFGVSIVEPSAPERNARATEGIRSDVKTIAAQPPPKQLSDAADLFLQTAARVRGSDVDREREREAAERIGSLVRGMPLAITLAAAWLRVLSAEEIAAELADGTDLLASEDADVDARHRSVRTVFDATWSRLRKGERDAWARLSIFEGGFRREAAQKVADVGLPLLLALANKSIVRRVSGSRFDFHPLVRQYGLEHGFAAGDRAAFRERHARWYLEWVAHTAPSFRGPDQVRALASVVTEMPNIRAAWSTAVDMADASLLVTAAPALWTYFEIIGDEEAFIPFAHRVVDALGDPTRVRDDRVEAQRAVAWVWPFATEQGGGYFGRLETSLRLAVRLGDAELAARAHAEFAAQRPLDKDAEHRDKAIEAYRSLGDEHGVARVRKAAGWQLVLAGDYDEAKALLEQAAARFRLDGDQRLEGAALDDIVVIDILRGDLDRADERIARVEAIHRDVGIDSTRAERAGTRRWIAVVRRDWERAERFQEEYLAFEAHVAGDHFPLTAGMLRAELHLGRGELDLAREHIGSALEVLRTMDGAGFGAPVIHNVKARIDLRDGNPAAARPHLREALRWSLELEAPRFLQNTAVATAELLLREGRDELAHDILAAALADPATEFEVRREIGQLVRESRERFDARPKRPRAWVADTIRNVLEA